MYKDKAAQSTYGKGDFKSVIEYNEHVKTKKRAVSMTTLHSIYGIGVNDLLKKICLLRKSQTKYLNQNGVIR